MEHVETAVIGAGQAGLVMSQRLRQLGIEHIVLERARVAESWRTQRWDSLMFQFPNWTITLPGHPFAHVDSEAFSTKDDIVRFLQDYSASINAPVLTGVDFQSLRRNAHGSGYALGTTAGEIAAKNVVVATGPYQKPKFPAVFSSVPTDLLHIHSAEYRRPTQLPDGAVLVVGTGASGCQIAEELLQSGRKVYLSVGRHRRIPRRYRGKESALQNPGNPHGC
jgi:putative flavoprotein involved in K+ transport